MNLVTIEDRLADQLERDRKHPSRCRRQSVTTAISVHSRHRETIEDAIVVTPSGTAVGLAIAVGAITGERDTDAIMSRVMARRDAERAAR